MCNVYIYFFSHSFKIMLVYNIIVYFVLIVYPAIKESLSYHDIWTMAKRAFSTGRVWIKASPTASFRAAYRRS